MVVIAHPLFDAVRKSYFIHYDIEQLYVYWTQINADKVNYYP